MATTYDEKTTNPVNISLEMPRLLKVSWYSSISPVMTHSRPPMALSMPSMINMKKKITDQNWEPGSVATACGYTSNTSPGPCQIGIRLQRRIFYSNKMVRTGVKLLP